MKIQAKDIFIIALMSYDLFTNITKNNKIFNLYVLKKLISKKRFLLKEFNWDWGIWHQR